MRGERPNNRLHLGRQVIRNASAIVPFVERRAHERTGLRRDLSLGGSTTANYLYARGATRKESVMKRRDPIIDDLHKLREKIGRAHDFDVDRIAATIRQHEQEGQARVIRTVPKRPTRHRKAS